MPRKFEGNAARREKIVCRQEAALDRMRAAVDALERENRILQAEVGEFQDVIGDLRSGIKDLAGSMDDYRFGISGIRTGGLRRAAQRLGEIADDWQERCVQSTGAPSARPFKGAA